MKLSPINAQAIWFIVEQQPFFSRKIHVNQVDSFSFLSFSTSEANVCHAGCQASVGLHKDSKDYF